MTVVLEEVRVDAARVRELLMELQNELATTIPGFSPAVGFGIEAAGSAAPRSGA